MMTDEEYIQKYGKTRKQLLDDTKRELFEARKAGDKSKVKQLAEYLKQIFIGDDVDWANEVTSNFYLAIVMGALIVILVASVIFNLTGLFNFGSSVDLLLHVSICIIELIIGISVYIATQGEKPWVKYVEMLVISLTVASAFTIFGYGAEMTLCVPVLLSTKYLSEKFTKTVCAVTAVIMLVGNILTVFMSVSVDLNTVAFQRGTIFWIWSSLPDAAAAMEESIDWHQYLINQLTMCFIPEFMQFVLISWICNTVAKWGHRTMKAQAKVTEEFTRVDTELNMAKDIQTNVLPNIFPAFPERPELDIYATMAPAREVGGDFYDFFLIDDDHVALVIADVSGKGMPAALFMMIGKALIKNQALQGKSPAEVMTAVNTQLCDNNQSGLFITAWVGILELSTGKLTASNAGHEYPFLKRADGLYEAVKDKHCFVLGGMEGSRYTEYELTLQPGDRLFVYTDGVTEATDARVQQFGMDNLRSALNDADQSGEETILAGVRAAVDAFVGTAPQFDDMTMLGVTYTQRPQNDCLDLTK